MHISMQIFNVTLLPVRFPAFQMSTHNVHCKLFSNVQTTIFAFYTVVIIFGACKSIGHLCFVTDWKRKIFGQNMNQLDESINLNDGKTPFHFNFLTGTHCAHCPPVLRVIAQAMAVSIGHRLCYPTHGERRGPL